MSIVLLTIFVFYIIPTTIAILLARAVNKHVDHYFDRIPLLFCIIPAGNFFFITVMLLYSGNILYNKYIKDKKLSKKIRQGYSNLNKWVMSE